MRIGTVVPILPLTGDKIAGTTVLARTPHDELEAFFCGYGYPPSFVDGDDPRKMHQLMAATLEAVVTEIPRIQRCPQEGVQGSSPLVHEGLSQSSEGDECIDPSLFSTQPKASNCSASVWDPFWERSSCPLRIACLTSIPAIVPQAAQHDVNPHRGRTLRFPTRWSCSTR